MSKRYVQVPVKESVDGKKAHTRRVQVTDVSAPAAPNRSTVIGGNSVGGESSMGGSNPTVSSAMDRFNKLPAGEYRGVGNPNVAEEDQMLHEGVAIVSRFPSACERVSDSVATRLHDAWRAPRALADGSFEPRLKDDGVGGQVDIANTGYADLPPKWQAENAAAAAGAIQAVSENPRDLEAAASAVHEDWLSRNGEWAEPEQKLPYAQLSEVEKEKDRVVVRAAREEIASYARLWISWGSRGSRTATR